MRTRFTVDPLMRPPITEIETVILDGGSEIRVCAFEVTGEAYRKWVIFPDEWSQPRPTAAWIADKLRSIWQNKEKDGHARNAASDK